IVNDNPENLKNINILRDYQLKDNRIKLILNERNIGLAESLNKAAKLAIGDYFVRMDADDISDYTRIEKQLKVMTENEYDLICTNYYYINENGDILDKSVEIFSSKTISILLKYRNIIHHPTVTIKRQSFEKLN